MPKPEFKATVEISREWNGEKVAEELVHKLKSKTPNPKFILLFTTIHYQNEFKPILSGLKDAFPDSPLIGGTVAGFITPEGCFTRGVTCLAVDYPDMDVAVGVGHDAKKDYKQAVDSALFELNKKKSKLPSRFIIEILPSATIPSFPGIGQKNVILSEKIGDRAVSLIPLATKFNFGSDRADEILERLSSKTSEVIIGGCTMDDNKLIRSYQFCDNKIFNSELCLLKFFTTMKARLFTMFGFQPMKKEFLITKIDENKRIVSEINHEKARTAFLNMLGWKESDLGQLYQLSRRIFYYP
ncbi:MAG: FIST N-terminal domain-containing protein, partial [Candidatus Aenigmatarchaeota archaeon]